MRSGRGLLSLALLALLSPYARASEWYTGAPGSMTPTQSSPSYISFFDASTTTPAWTKSSAPVAVEPYSAPSKFGVAIDTALTADTKGSRFASVIGTIAPFSEIDRSGLRLRISGVVGTYGYTNTAVGQITGTMQDGSVLIGYEWMTAKASFGIYGGIDFSNNQLNKYDANNGSVGQATGAKIALDFSYRPTATMMLSGVASYSSAHSAYYARLKAGWAIAPSTYVGPEVIFMGDAFFQQWRVGGHITGATFGPVQLGASAGLMNDRVRGSGIYGILDGRLAF